MKKLYVHKNPDHYTTCRRVYADSSPGPDFEEMTEDQYSSWLSQQPPPQALPPRPEPQITEFMLWLGNYQPIAEIMAAARQRVTAPQGEPSTSGMVTLMEPSIKAGDYTAFRAAWNQTLMASAQEGVTATAENLEEIIQQAIAHHLPQEFITALVPDQVQP